eukprot:54857-Eustigmatos_ZCMA.PRE.1
MPVGRIGYAKRGLRRLPQWSNCTSDSGVLLPPERVLWPWGWGVVIRAMSAHGKGRLELNASCVLFAEIGRRDTH